MESKICSYTEKNARLQLLKVVSDSGIITFEIRLNRKTIDIYNNDLAFEARLLFLHSVHELCVNRNIHVMSNMS